MKQQWGGSKFFFVVKFSNSTNRSCCNKEGNFSRNILFRDIFYRADCVIIWAGDVDSVSLLLKLSILLEGNVNLN